MEWYLRSHALQMHESWSFNYEIIIYVMTPQQGSFSKHEGTFEKEISFFLFSFTHSASQWNWHVNKLFEHFSLKALLIAPPTFNPNDHFSLPKIITYV